MKAQIDIKLVIDGLILIRHLKKGAQMFDNEFGNPMLPKGFSYIGEIREHNLVWTRDWQGSAE